VSSKEIPTSNNIISSDLIDSDIRDLAVEDGLLRPEDAGNWTDLNERDQEIHAIRRHGYDVIDKAVAPENEHRLTGIFEAGIEIAHEAREVYKRHEDDSEKKARKVSIKGKLNRVPVIRRIVSGGGRVEEAIFDSKDHVPHTVGANAFSDEEEDSKIT
jgi:hypothetical protein